MNWINWMNNFKKRYCKLRYWDCRAQQTGSECVDCFSDYAKVYNTDKKIDDDLTLCEKNSKKKIGWTNGNIFNQQWEAVKMGATKVFSIHDLNSLNDHFKEQDTEEADLFYSSFITSPNPNRCGILDIYIGRIKKWTNYGNKPEVNLVYTNLKRIAGSQWEQTAEWQKRTRFQPQENMASM